MSENLPEGTAAFELPAHHRCRLRTSNTLERISREVVRRTHVATLCPNEAFLLRLVCAVAIELAEDWAIRRIYLGVDTG